jgi:heme o synthase
VSTLQSLARLTRLPIALLTTLSTLAAFVLARPAAASVALPATCLAVLCLALGASALNQCQERDLDGRMPRTRDRPLPTGALTLRTALLVSSALIASGAALLYAIRPLAAGLGLAAVLLYNGFYTPLKRVMAFVAIPGGVIGMLPPAIGWTAAGGAIDDTRLMALATFFFVWQVPHFWLLLLRRGDEYVAAGLPSPVRSLGQATLAHLTFAALAAAALGAPLLAWFGLTSSAWATAALLLSGALLLHSGGRLLGRPPANQPPFAAINCFLSAVMAVLVLDALTSTPVGLPR